MILAPWLQDVGWLSTLILSFCGLPLLWDTYRKGTCSSPFIFILMCFIGEITGLTYVFFKSDVILITNYALNTFIYGILLYYKISPRKSVLSNSAEKN